MTERVRSLACLLVLCTAAVAAAAEPTPDAKQKAKALVGRGELEFKLGHFGTALSSFTEAYAIFPSPALLFNLGQCHRNLKNDERAIFFFEGYLRERPKSENRPVVEKLIAESRRRLESERAATDRDKRIQADEAERQRLVALKAYEDAKVAAAHVADRPAATTDVAVTTQASKSKPPVYKRWWFWTSLVVVAGAGVVAGTLGYYYSGAPVSPSGSLGTLDRR
jgi:tetratricopeptide (TPR) repeat protein